MKHAFLVSYMVIAVYNLFSFFMNDDCRETGDEDVRLKVLYCGVCHSDLHSVRNEWFDAMYPLIPG